MKARQTDDAERQLVDLVRADYDATQRALSGFVSSGGQLRAIGIGAWGVVFAVAVQAQSGLAAAVAALLAIGFAVIDGYYSALYRQTLKRARNLEEILGAYHNSLGIHAANPRKVLQARARLEQHRFGVHRGMMAIHKMDQWWLPRPVRVTWIYAVLIALAIGATAYFEIKGASTCQNGRHGAEPCVVYTTVARPVSPRNLIPGPPLPHPWAKPRRACSRRRHHSCHPRPRLSHPGTTR